MKKHSVTHKSKKGRPLESPQPRDEFITIRLNKRELECLNMWVFRYDLSVSECVRELLKIHSIIPE